MNLSAEHATATTPFEAGAAGNAVPRAAGAPITRHPTELDMGELLRFKAMMLAEGHSVHVARMCYDRRYAYERIASAHASANDPLRRVALGLFQVCHRRDEARSAPR